EKVRKETKKILWSGGWRTEAIVATCKKLA
ncbi:hypothetical protein LCGC14_2580330, partial [marine sediment metagenome]